jgi:hypothetical protein
MWQLFDISSIHKKRFYFDDLFRNIKAIVATTNLVATLGFAEPNAEGWVFEPFYIEVEYKNSQALLYCSLGLTFALAVRFYRGEASNIVKVITQRLYLRMI